MEWTVNFEFNKDVMYKYGSYVVIQDSNGKAYSSKSSYVDWDDDECEVYLSEALIRGNTYTFKIVGVKARGQSKYSTLTGDFVAY